MKTRLSLSAQDFLQSPVWEVDVRTEQVSPAASFDLSEDRPFLASTTFTLADGTVLEGFHFPYDATGFVVFDASECAFPLSVSERCTEDELLAAERKLHRPVAKIFPVRYELRVPSAGVSGKGVIHSWLGRIASVHRKLLMDWLAFKLDHSFSFLDRGWDAEHKIDYSVAGHSLFASLVIEAQPADSFSFAIVCPVPEGAPADLESNILAGVMDAIVPNEYSPLLGCAVVVKKIDWLECCSVPRLYYYCARECMRKIIALDGSRENIPRIS